MPTSTFGDLERAVLDVLWAAPADDTGDPGDTGDTWLTVREVHAALSARDVAYTTVMTVLDRLARKEQILQRRDGRAYLYRPRASRSEMIADLMHGTLEEFGAHDRQSALVAFVEDASADDVEALRAALARLDRS